MVLALRVVLVLLRASGVSTGLPTVQRWDMVPSLVVLDQLSGLLRITQGLALVA